MKQIVFAPPHIIRKATSDEASSLSALIQRTVRISNTPDYPNEIIEKICDNFSPERVAADLARRDVFVLIGDTEIVGTVSLGAGKLHSLFVDPDYQRLGLGAELVARLEAHAITVGLRELHLSSSITARRFYESQGYNFREMEQRTNGMTYLMHKYL